MSALKREDAREGRRDEIVAKVETQRDERKKAKVESLDQRIRIIEQRIDDRRDALAGDALAVGGKVRRGLSSPLLIVAAAGAGFIFAQFKKRRRPESRHKRDDREPVVVKPSLFASLTDALTLATTILALLPLISRKAGKEAAKEAVDAHDEVSGS